MTVILRPVRRRVARFRPSKRRSRCDAGGDKHIFSVIRRSVARGPPVNPPQRAKLGIEPITTPREFAVIIAQEVPTWPAVVRITGVKVAE